MRTPATLLIIALLGIPLGAHAAATSPPGVNIRWDRCFGDAGPANKTFACNTNTGTDRLVLSFELAQPLTDVVSITSRVEITSASDAVPAWWALFTSGSCRQTALSYSTLAPAGSVSCIDWAAGGATGAVSAYTPSYLGGTNAKEATTIMTVPTNSAVNLSNGIEYSTGSLGISHLKTVGTGACAGCATPICLLFSDIAIQSLDANGAPTIQTRLTKGANFIGSSIVSWQNSYASAVFRGFPSGDVWFPAIVARCVPYDVTSSHPSTWGQIKSLYR